MDPTPPPGGNANPTAAQLAETLRLHTNAWKAYKLMRATERNLRNQLLAAADNIYWQRLPHVRLGYNMCSIQDMLYHLIESYGRFTETERKEVASRMEVPWEGGPLEFVIQQISDAANAFALAGTPLSAQQKTDKLYDLVKERGPSPTLASVGACFRRPTKRGQPQPPISSSTRTTAMKNSPPKLPGISGQTTPRPTATPVRLETSQASLPT
jgi:hypothetical protein